MSGIGIIANPSSGKDIRRLVTHASVYDNLEKTNILRRMLLAMDTLGIRNIYYMPDYDNLVNNALRGIRVSLEAIELKINMWGDKRDTAEAAKWFCENDIGCIVTLGGDGTNRIVASVCNSIPLVPVSTGTNNVFPVMVEGTIAGLAAALVTQNSKDLESCTYTAKQLKVYVDEKLVDNALIDVVVCAELFVGSRAIWDPNQVTEIVLAQAKSDCIGMSCIGGLIKPFGATAPLGLYIKLGQGEMSVLAPIAPGVISNVRIEKYRSISLGERVSLEKRACTIALDGERELEIEPSQQVSVLLSDDGPRVVDIGRCLREAARLGILKNRQFG